MKLLALWLTLPFASLAVSVESLPQSEYADTEVSTNIPFEVRFDAMSRMNFSISLKSSPSNSVRRGKCGICELMSVEGAKSGATLLMR